MEEVKESLNENLKNGGELSLLDFIKVEEPSSPELSDVEIEIQLYDEHYPKSGDEERSMIDVDGHFTQDDDSESTLSVCTDSTETVCGELEFQFREEEISLLNNIYSEDTNFDSPCDLENGLEVFLGILTIWPIFTLISF